MSKEKSPAADASDEAERLKLENENLQLEIELLNSQQAVAQAQAKVAAFGLSKTEILGRAAEAKFIADAMSLESDIYERAKAARNAKQEATV